MKKNSKIYVAGHRGLVGSAICKNLQSKGYTNLIGKSIKELNLLNQQDVANFFEKEKPEYVILAAAKVGGIIANNTYRGQFIYENLQIQNNIIHQSYIHGVKKLLFLGSTCIYPKLAPQPMPEDCLLSDELEYTNEPYAIAKIAGLKMCESYNLQYGTNFISVMPTNLYGPNDNFDLEKSHVLPAMIRKIHLAKCLEDKNWDAIRDDLSKRPVEGIDGQAKEEEIISILGKYGINLIKANQQDNIRSTDHHTSPNKFDSVRDNVVLKLWGTGKPLREFLWSEEMADACVFVMEKVDFKDILQNQKFQQSLFNNEQIASPDSRDRNDGEIKNTHINIGTGKEVSIHQLSELIKKEIGYTGKIEFDSTNPDGTMRKLTNPGKLQDLGWHHNVEIEEGVHRIYEWYLQS